jgi:hypothetical protein
MLERIDGAARHVLADDVRPALPARAAIVPHVVDGDDVGVVAEPSHRLRLAADPGEAVGVQTIRLDYRNGDVAVEFGVVSEVDALAAAFPEEALYGVATAGEGGWQGG